MTEYKLIGGMTPERTLHFPGGLSLCGGVILAFMHNKEIARDVFIGQLRIKLLKEGFIKVVEIGA